jgi:TrmH family RNA methyltransferase
MLVGVDVGGRLATKKDRCRGEMEDSCESYRALSLSASICRFDLESKFMVSKKVLDRVVVVLVRARNPNNIGAVARAMHDFGFRHLRIVNEYAVPFETARSAVDASEVLAGAVEFSSLAEAVADCTLVVGTTAVGERALQHPLHALADAAEKIGAEANTGKGRVALLFGSEKTGLSNDELSHCHWLLTIPMQDHEEIRHPSMNLGQAVAVCLYELLRGGGNVPAKSGFVAAADAGEVERLTVLLSEVLEKTGYTKRHPANCDEAQIRRLVVKMGLSAGDAPVWMGILRQVLWKVRGS